MLITEIAIDSQLSID